MSSIDKSGTYALGTRTVKRLGYGAMQLAGPGVFGPPKDKQAALDVLREAVAAGVNHIDTSQILHFSNALLQYSLENVSPLQSLSAPEFLVLHWLLPSHSFPLYYVYILNHYIHSVNLIQYTLYPL